MELTDEKTKMKNQCKLNIIMSIVKYLVVNAFLVFVNLMTTPNYLWVLWVIAGWGIGLILTIVTNYLEFKYNNK
ncbi:MAG: 2TM domain-containing protein [Bacteroides graminisolvens]|jgi:E3 ubiquitin-protein ligase DOA10|uniref:2TM domain-containing protein n=1 Tax=Bacteroides graminisolvens TaxID=477666 RepID=UPI000A74C103|nr:2TM domain-containing protein [Bacteroides graminisolvens]MBP6069368.1 2TM domain-containing protein [Bacteroides sp.]MBP6248338.1 2TM domain-containing protein [Bacteroides sp.]MBP6980510.1 2TM domain-containing protein [Bacteroides sp.]MBP7292818.1 2TM domain-containing protein [Bacteroides sp.]MBP9495516.1 2TM domain-containing protein [Bacteroides sp.]